MYNERCTESQNTTNVVIVLYLLSREETDLKNGRLGGLHVHTDVPNRQIGCNVNFRHSTVSTAWLDKQPLRRRYLRHQSKYRESSPLCYVLTIICFQMVHLVTLIEKYQARRK